MQKACQLPDKDLRTILTGNYYPLTTHFMQKFPFEDDQLKIWFQKQKRDLPWRNNPSPYAVWISEVMLQQTQVFVVKDYFLRWMARFPTIEHLARASLDDVIKMWEGLGYYSRARNIHLAAQQMVANHNAEPPSNPQHLSQIPGIGPYTAGAILSFAFKQKAAAVDGNVLRVLARYFAITESIGLSTTRKKIWEIAENLLPDKEPWLVTEGLIELGATVCKKQAQCWQCPIQFGCKARQLNLQDALPKMQKRPSSISLVREVFVICHEKDVLIKKAATQKVMAGLYEFPFIEKEKNKENAFPFCFAAKKSSVLPQVEHSFTRYRVKLLPSVWLAKQKLEIPGYVWVERDALHLLPFSAGHRKILKNWVQ